MPFFYHLLPKILLTCLALSLFACNNKKPPDKQVRPVEVVTHTVKSVDTPVSFEFVGKTESSRKVEIRSRVEGFLEKRLYLEGSFVDEGDVLFQMDKKPFEAQLNAAKAELAQQQARLDTAKTNLNRVRPLVKKNAVAQKELDDALGNYRSSAASVEVAKANVIQAELDLGYTEIKSPVYGLTSFATQQEGAYIGMGSDSLLTYVAKIDPMRVEFSVSENQILKSRSMEQSGLLKMPENNDFVVEIIFSDGTVYPHSGRITFTDASLNEQTGTFLMRAELANPDALLRPGQFIRAQIKGAIRPNAILVPKTAVQQGAKGSFVWVVNAKQQAEFRPVTTGAWKGDQWFINDGLKTGEKIVVEGGIRLRAGVQITEAVKQALQKPKQTNKKTL
ncbi:MAG: efflux RND transporter periplasmic adaptor subunit [Gammaproteobacteria bacterium]|nr:efflux RND transporter periplasmic adaptor subunit [Gammaproteobacteria bacterium]